MKKLVVSLIIGTGVSIAAIYFSFRNVPVADLTAYLFTINPLWAGISLLTSVSVMGLKGLRWQFIIASYRKTGFWPPYHSLAIGTLINFLLPARAGELARPLLLKQTGNVPYAAGMATVVMERLMDMVCLLIFFAISLSFVDIRPEIEIRFGDYVLNRELLMTIGRSMAMISMVLAAAVVLIGIRASRRRIINIIRKTPDVLFFFRPVVPETARRFFRWLEMIVETAGSGFSMIHNPVQAILSSVMTLITWVLSVLAVYFFARGCPGIGITIAETTVVMVVMCFFIALPSAPGFWGVWEAGTLFGLLLFGISSTEGAGFALANHVVQMLVVLILGVVSVFVTGVNIFKIAGHVQKQETDTISVQEGS